MKQSEIQLTLAKGEYLTLLFFCMAAIPLVFCWLAWTQVLHSTTLGLLFLLVVGVVYFVSQLAQDHPEYIINDSGIRFGAGLGGHFIPWTDVEAISDERQLDGPNYVELRLKANAPYWASLSALRKHLLRVYEWGQEPIPAAHLHTAGLEASHQEILAILHYYFQKHQEYFQKHQECFAEMK